MPLMIALLASLLTFGQPALAPLQWSVFAVHAAQTDVTARPGRTGVHAELAAVNEHVNAMISPERAPLPPVGNGWSVWPVSGWCGDYAVTKRHELLARGWPSSALLLAEVVRRNGEHHAILLAQTASGWFVLDNLTADVLPTSKVGYRVARVQSAMDPRAWFSVKELPQ